MASHQLQARSQAPSTQAGSATGLTSARGAGGRQAAYGNDFLLQQAGLTSTSAGASTGTASPTTAGPTTASPTTAGPTTAPPTPGTGATTAQGAASTGGALSKVTSPLPVQAGAQSRTVLGVTIIGSDVSPSALDACEAFVRATVGNRRDIQQRLQREHTTLVIIPRNKKMTDLPEFASLRGTNTFDHRLWDDVRGSGGMRISGDRWAIGVPEENLISAGPDAYGDGYSVGLHEFAHTILLKGLSRAERREASALYDARSRAGGPFTETYGASNVDEYFAQSTNCFFGRNVGVGQNGAAWLEANDRPMYDFLVRLYGAPAAAAQGAGASTAAPAPAAAAPPAHAAGAPH